MAVRIMTISRAAATRATTAATTMNGIRRTTRRSPSRLARVDSDNSSSSRGSTPRSTDSIRTPTKRKRNVFLGDEEVRSSSSSAVADAIATTTLTPETRAMQVDPDAPGTGDTLDHLKLDDGGARGSEEGRLERVLSCSPSPDRAAQKDKFSTLLRIRTTPSTAESVKTSSSRFSSPGNRTPRQLKRSLDSPLSAPGSPGSSSHFYPLIGELVVEGNLERTEHILNSCTDTASRQRCLDSKEIEGYTPLMHALSIEDAALRMQFVDLLLRFGANIFATDIEGWTVLHWASASECKDVAVIRKLHAVDRSILDVQCKRGETSLHCAAREGYVEIVKELLQLGANPLICNEDAKFPYDVSGEIDTRFPNAATRSPRSTTQLRSRLHRAFHSLCPQLRTLLCYNEGMVGHDPGEGHQENPGRILSLRSALGEAMSGRENVVWESEFRPACLSKDRKLFMLAHSADYIRSIEDMNRSVDLFSPTRPPLPFTPVLQRTMMRNKKAQPLRRTIEETKPLIMALEHVSQKRAEAEMEKEREKEREREKGELMSPQRSSHESSSSSLGTPIKTWSDTSFGRGTLHAALLAVGAIRHAIDRVTAGTMQRAMCLVRPPGHHAGFRGPTVGARSCGFCIFNTVMIGALHFLLGEETGKRRVAIVDFDVHHGNGTEDIIANLPLSLRNRLFFSSVHLYDRSDTAGPNDYFFYPGTGRDDDLLRNVVNVPLDPFWKDNCPFEKEKRGAESGKEGKETKGKESSDSSSPDEKATELAGNSRPRRSRSVQRPAGYYRTLTTANGSGSTSGGANTESLLFHPAVSEGAVRHKGREAFERRVRERILPGLRAFAPDLILISAGFDGAKHDVGNCRLFPSGSSLHQDVLFEGLDLLPADYRWITAEIVRIANLSCGGRVVSVLEGGYGRYGDHSGPIHGKPNKPFAYDHDVLCAACTAHVEALVGEG